MHNSGSNVKHWRLQFRFLTATGALLVKQIGKTDANKSKLVNIVHQQRALEESRHYRLQRAFLLIWPPSNVETKCRVLTSRAAFAWRSKLFPVGLPNNFIAFIWGRHLALSIGRLVMPQGRTPREMSEISETEITFLDTKAYKEVRFDNLTRYFRKYLSEVKFANMKTALQQRNKSESKKFLPFATQYHPALPSLKRIHMWK